MKQGDNWRVEVAYATPLRQEVVELPVDPGTTIEQAIRASGMLERFPEIDLSQHRVGIFGELADLHDPVHDDDRIEIYRPLLADPKEVRRKRAKAAGGRKKTNAVRKRD
ncbi:MAG: RnfH family protein [Sulfuricaulis sp.]|uniref:RnfH family protein n=1 Tax=Sulfuricaulis sp. TaxID=2003553 RepID=UPI0025CD4851|nr:RnfH family protein [Sulfuricaulis sp.]MCR4347368.1 RnfH family protein [Sulfuricaulis sp.]